MGFGWMSGRRKYPGSGDFKLRAFPSLYLVHDVDLIAAVAGCQDLEGWRGRGEFHGRRNHNRQLLQRIRMLCLENDVTVVGQVVVERELGCSGTQGEIH